MIIYVKYYLSAIKGAVYWNRDTCAVQAYYFLFIKHQEIEVHFLLKFSYHRPKLITALRKKNTCPCYYSYLLSIYRYNSREKAHNTLDFLDNSPS